MSSIRKLIRTEEAAYGKLVAARADLVAAIAERNGSALCGNTAAARAIELGDAEVARLRRRVGAYSAQWEAAARNVEAAAAAREVGQ